MILAMAMSNYNDFLCFFPSFLFSLNRIVSKFQLFSSWPYLFFFLDIQLHRLQRAVIQSLNNQVPISVSENLAIDWSCCNLNFIVFQSIFVHFFGACAGITSGRGYAHGEVGIAYIDIESVCNRMDCRHFNRVNLLLGFVGTHLIFVLYAF